MLRLIRPLHLLFAALTYSFGASLADFLGRSVNPISFWLGLFIVLLAQVTMNMVAEVFRLDAEPLLENLHAPAAWRAEPPARCTTAYELEWQAQGRDCRYFWHRRVSDSPVA